MPLNPFLESIRNEIYTEPFSSIDFNQCRYPVM